MNRLLYLLVVLLLAYCYTKLPSSNIAYPEINYTIEEFIKSRGYDFVTYSIVTEDGYILELHHIPPRDGISSQKTPVFFMHGLGCSSMTFLTLGENSLPCQLVDRGYDVWLGNARGNVYSQNHVSIDYETNLKNFMNFSWHEIAVLDLPAMIDHVLAATKQDKLVYIGYSQGCTTFYALMSERPEYNKKVELMIGLAPAVFMRNTKSAYITYFRQFSHIIEIVTDNIGVYEFFPRHIFWTKFGNLFCKDYEWTQRYCHYPYSIVGGYNPEGINQTLLPFMYATFPAGCSFRQYLHFLQISQTGQFQKYDYGEETNIKKYGQPVPPAYNLANVKVPVAHFYSANDWLVVEEDVQELSQKLPNTIRKTKVPVDLFNHFDFMMSPLSVDSLNPDVIRLIETNVPE